MDRRLRNLERAALEDPAAKRPLLRAYLDSGRLHLNDVRAAAALGHLPSIELTGTLPPINNLPDNLSKKVYIALGMAAIEKVAAAIEPYYSEHEPVTICQNFRKGVRAYLENEPEFETSDFRVPIPSHQAGQHYQRLLREAHRMVAGEQYLLLRELISIQHEFSRAFTKKPGLRAEFAIRQCIDLHRAESGCEEHINCSSYDFQDHPFRFEIYERVIEYLVGPLLV